MRTYQRSALYYCLRVQHPALFMEMRLGKTLVTIRAIQHWESDLNLVVCPYSAWYDWRLELKLENEFRYGITDLIGTSEKRQDSLIDGLKDGDRWFLINWEGYRVLPEINHIKWNSVVLDESRKIANPRTKMSEFYTYNFRKADHRCILSGLPAPEGEYEFYQQMRYLDPHIFDERNYWEFRNNHFEDQNYRWTPTGDGLRYIQDRMRNRCFFLSRSDVDLGGIKIHRRRYVKPSDKFKRIYRTAVREFILETEKKMVSSTIYAPVRDMWLRKLCGGFVDKEFIFDGKLNLLLELLKGELYKQQVVIFCAFTWEIAFLKTHLNAENIKTDMIYRIVPYNKRLEIREQFDLKQIRTLVAQPQCLKYGANLSRADAVIFYSNEFSLETRIQIEDRVIDVAKTDSKLFIDLIVENTIDEDIVDALFDKDSDRQYTERLIKRGKLWLN